MYLVNTMTASTKQLRLFSFFLMLASYLFSFFLVYLLTRDFRHFILPALECAFLFVVLSARLLFPKLPQEIKPRVSLRLAEGRTPHAA